ncbi:MAG TPA: GatB/YqeY domain-containing protein [Clostridia bacterium]|nr:GatB/YqeY domain-containing protein [Clostridia bacterium]
MILDEIKKANIQALRDHNENARNILGVVLNKIKLCEISKRELKQDITEPDVVAILQKSLKELAEEKEGYEKVGNEQRAKTIAEQAEIVEAFMPKLMSEKEIKDVILSLSDNSLPFVMKHFKENFAGKCDMRLVQQVLKSL